MSDEQDRRLEREDDQDSKCRRGEHSRSRYLLLDASHEPADGDVITVGYSEERSSPWPLDSPGAEVINISAEFYSPKGATPFQVRCENCWKRLDA